MNSKDTYFFIFRRPNEGPVPTPEEMQRTFQQWSHWISGLRSRGQCVGGHPLQSEGQVIRGTKGRTVVDGPFLEGKEICGGFIAVLARDLEEATELARGCPGYATGHSVEIRALPGAYEGPRESRLNEEQVFLFAFRDPLTGADPSSEQIDELMGWLERLGSQGRILAHGPLQLTPARVLRGPHGQQVTDGPFAEAKEVFAGYMVVKAGSLSEATALARTCPILAAATSIEVRPIGRSSAQELEVMRSGSATHENRSQGSN